MSLLKTGSAYYAPSAAAAEMCESIVKDKKRIIPSAAYLNGEYGVNGMFIGVPVKLGKEGVEEVIEVELSSEERKAFMGSVEAVRKLIGELKL